MGATYESFWAPYKKATGNFREQLSHTPRTV